MFVRTRNLLRLCSLATSQCPRACSRVSTAPVQTYSRRTNPQPPTPKRLISNMTGQNSKQNEPTIHDIFEKNTSTWQYIVADPTSSHAVIIDPVLDYDRSTQTISTDSADNLLSMVKEQGYMIDMILETHVHADHLTAASYLQAKLSRAQDGVQPVIGIGKRIETVQSLFGQRYGIPEAQYKGIFGKYFDDDEEFQIGGIGATVLHLPGHTPDHLGYKIGGTSSCFSSFPILIRMLINQRMYFAATLSSTQILALHAVTFPVAVPTTSTTLVGNCSVCPTTSRSGRAMITPHKDGRDPDRG